MREKDIAHLGQIAKLDLLRESRCGIPEFILASGKSEEEVFSLLRAMACKRGVAAATKVSHSQIEYIKARGSQISPLQFHYHQDAAMVVFQKKNHRINKKGKIGVLSAGSADIKVAEEVRITAQILGCHVLFDYDVGVAGIHRMVQPLKRMLQEKVACVVVVAGMDGVLPVLVKSLVEVPVIGVPVSTGYGFGGEGEAALKTMLQACSPGLTVVNIDNGFGAACAAYLIVKQVVKKRSERK